MLSVEVQPGYSEKPDGVLQGNPLGDLREDNCGTPSVDPLQASSGEPVAAVGQKDSPWEEEQDADGGKQGQAGTAGPISVYLLKVEDVQRGVAAMELWLSRSHADLDLFGQF